MPSIDERHAAATPDYARLPIGERRWSRLAFASLVVPVLSSPLLLGSFLGWLNWYLPDNFEREGRYGGLQALVLLGGMLLGVVLPVASIVHIRSSGGARRGLGIAVIALGLGIFSWLWLGWKLLAWQDFHPS